MKTYLKSQGLLKVVETDESTPALGENPTVAQLRTYDTESLKKDKALTCLHSGIADQFFTSIMDLETPKAVWDKLQETFEGTDRVNAVRLLTLKREFELLRMKDDELVKDYSARMMDVEKVEGAFRVSSRSNKAGNSKQNTFRRGNFSKGNNKGSTSQNSSSTSNKGTFPPCNICHNTNHQEVDCWFKDKPNFKCNFCNKFGHLEKYCRAKKARNNTQGVQQENISEEDQVDDEHLFMESHLDKHPDSLTWLMDSGCTSHMTPERSFFISLDTKDNPRVKMGDGRYTQAKRRGENRASWSDKLDDALWAFCTAYKTPIGCTPYKLVYRKACHLLVELEHKAYSVLKHANFDLKTAGDHRKVQINELNEIRDHAYENYLIYKEKIKRFHDSKIKHRVFNIGDRVLLFNSLLKIFFGKLKSRWSGPFTIFQVYPYVTVELSQPDGPNFKVNGHRLKH
nr:reverse transcriptase domain-containing protein [Tanacetum cinerariifolium]